ncbi:MAG: hypothetical protein HKP40_04055, partial [Litoreibacter sp.]|nr:hypothetical protein [Litoreibacter sp.]
MNSNFALDLSEDGIVLLHRATADAAWDPIASVALDSETLASDLNELRMTAEALEGEGFTTELILPESQLLYATISIENDVKSEVEAALEERTPYKIEELVYDTDGDGPEVRIAAVARETLREAEEFISPYNLNAIAFTARPGPTLFSRPPDLGKTEGATQQLSSSGASRAPASEITEPLASPDVPVQEPAATGDKPETAQDSADTVPSTSTSGFFTTRKYSDGDAVEEVGKALSTVPGRIAIGRPDTPGKPTPRKAIVPDRPKSSIIVKAPNPVPVIPPPPAPELQATGTTTAKTPVQRDPIAELAARQSTSGPAPIALILAFVSLVGILFVGAYATGYIGGAPEPVELAVPVQDPQPPAVPETAAAQTGLSKLETGSLENVTVESAMDPVTLRAKPTLQNPPENEDVVASAANPAPVRIAPAVVPDQTNLAGDASQGAAVDLAAPTLTGPVDETGAETAYVATGIWQMSPKLSDAVRPATLEGLYIASLDPSLAFEDAPALSTFSGRTDRLQNKLTSPPPAGTVFDLDARGLVKPTPEGALNANGILIFAGKPPIAALQRPDGAVVEQTLQVDERLAGFRPEPRPDDLIEARERALLGGRTRSELAAIRPQLRPENARARDAAIASARAEAGALGGLANLKPAPRPANIERLA